MVDSMCSKGLTFGLLRTVKDMNVNVKHKKEPDTSGE